MALEIERKFLVDMKKLPFLPAGETIRQGYICAESGRTVRVRIYGDEAFLTLKGKTVGVSRSEFEYSIPIADAQQLLSELCLGPQIDKVRHRIPHGQHLWELDIFSGDNQGLVVAEVELAHEHEAVELPEWITQEVTGQKRYYNSSLLDNPFQRWQD